jgi:four helix bundle protein
MKIRSFRDLRVWSAGIDLVEEVYRLTQLFPQYEIYSLANQMRRASVSIPSNIAEGHEREHLKEYLHHLSIAQGSLAELVTQIEIAVRLGYLAKANCNQIVNKTESLGKQIRALRTSLMNTCNP